MEAPCRTRVDGVEISAMANEVSQAEARFGVNPSLAMVCTGDITNDIAMATIAGIRSGAYMGSRRRPVALAAPGGLRS